MALPAQKRDHLFTRGSEQPFVLQPAMKALSEGSASIMVLGGMLAKSKKVTFVEQVSREQSEYFRKQINFSTGNICPSAMSIMVSTAAARSSLRLWRQPAAGKFWQAGAYFSTSCDQERSMAVPRQEPSPRCWLIEAAEQA